MGGSKNPVAVIITGDHGLGYGKSYRGQSKNAERDRAAPPLILALPAWFAERYPSEARALRRNTALLTGHYDIYHTVLHLMRLGTGEDDKRTGDGAGTKVRGRSLLEPLAYLFVELLWYGERLILFR